MKMASRGVPGRNYFAFNLPVALSTRIHPDTEFEPEMTEEGILFRVISAPPQKTDSPRWLRQGREPRS